MPGRSITRLTSHGALSASSLSYTDPRSTFASCGNRVALPDMLVQLQMVNEVFSPLSPPVSYFFVLNFAGDFIKLMNASDVTLPEKKQEIQAYRKQLQEDVKKSSNLSQGFYNLRNAVDRFQRGVLEFFQSGDELESQVQTLKENLDKIRKEIDRLTKQGFLDATALVSLGGVAAGGFAIGVLCPFLWIGAAVGTAFPFGCELLFIKLDVVLGVRI
ncbi:hypothetical protein EDD16DRAFT_454673 [Pisolithus croceorrhizus]|nr:hypothetical protein EDD16DRAFT_454673 [Pisolithus croceorrhizus]